MKVLIVGSGGREHCLAWKISKSPLVNKIYCAPGNGGTAMISENINIAADNIEALAEFALIKKIDLTIVGPEVPLVAGIVDLFESKDLKIFGPSKELAQFEGSKVFTKEVLNRFNIPTAEYKFFKDASAAKKYIDEKGVPIVIKADGLAAGKGVIVAGTIDEAYGAVTSILEDKIFGVSGESIIIEECLRGEEASILAIVDGANYKLLLSSQDHKRAYDGDAGPNTGGMGAYAPALLITDLMIEKIKKTIFDPLMAGLKSEGKQYKGVLYAGLMIKDGVPFVLEFNVRFGDPETQAILPMLKTDLVEIIIKSIEGKLDEMKNLEWEDGSCVSVVLASGGYPGKYEKGKKINGIEKVGEIDGLVFQAGTKQLVDQVSGKRSFVTSGGRVLKITAIDKNLKKAQKKVYKLVKKIDFEGIQYRNDIGNKALQFLNG